MVAPHRTGGSCSSCWYPLSPTQLEEVSGDTGRYDRELRPHMMKVAIAELQGVGHRSRRLEDRGHRRPGAVCRDRGAVPDRWTRSRRLRRSGPRCRRRRGGFAGFAPLADVEGYRGFAIGRSIWWNPLKFFVDGAVPRDETVVQIANNYRRFVAVWEQG